MKKQVRDGKGRTKKAPCVRSTMSGNEQKELSKALNGCNGNSTQQSLLEKLKRSSVWFKSEPVGNKLIRLESKNGYCGKHTVASVLHLAHS